MANEQNDSESGDDGGGEESKPKKDPHLERAIRERDAAKAKLREREDKAAENAELKARLAEYEAAKEAAAIEDEKKRNDFSAQAERLKKEIEAREKRAAEAEAKLAAREKRDRESALVDAVAGKAGVSRPIVMGLLRVAAESGFDNAPAELDDDMVADAIKKLRELEPELIKPRNGGSAGSPGVNLKNKPAGEDPTEDAKRAKARKAAEDLSPLRRKPATKD